MGSVWLCHDERLGREVAVKQVGGLPGESNMHLARALREARHSAALNHPNVVAIFDALEDGNHVWLVMEYVPSRTLDQIIRSDGAMPPVRAAAIAAQVADGLAAAHALGTVHRDVKPSNILVRDDDRALIADFGIARTVGQEQLTRTGMVTGTPVYFAPELARGGEPSPASDVWALGVSLYAAVEGGPPYPDQANAIALLNTIASQEPPPPSHAGALAEPIARMLDPDPATRWSMAQVASALHEIASGAAEAEPDDEQLPTTVLAATPPAEEPRPPDTVPTAARPAERAGPPEAEPTAPEQPRRGAALAVAAVLVLALVAVGGWWLTRDPDEDNTASPSGESSRTSSPKPSRTPSESGGAEASGEPSATQEESSEAPEDSQDSTPATSTADDAAGFVGDYYTFLPEDPDASWAMLSPELQERMGRGTFDGFWATIDDVQVDGAESVDDGLVEVTLTYTTDGQSEQETRQLQVEQTDDGYLISDDLGAV